MAFQAAVAFSGVRPLLTMLELNRSTAVLVLEQGSVPGRFTLERGRYVDARTATESGAAAYARLLACEGGIARIEPFVAPPERSLAEEPLPVLPEKVGMPGEVPSDAKMLGDGELPRLGEALELFVFSRGRAWLTAKDGGVVVADGTLVEATAGDKTGVDALFDLMDRARQSFAVVPAPDAQPKPEAPLHVTLSAAFEKLSDATFLRRKAEREDLGDLRSLLEDFAAGRVSREVRLAVARRLMPGLEPTPTEVLGRLCADADDAVRAAAKETVESLDVEVLDALIANPATPASLVAHLVEVFSGDAMVLAAAASNPSLEEATAVRLAQLADFTVADALLHSPWATSAKVRDALGKDSGDTMRRARDPNAPRTEVFSRPASSPGPATEGHGPPKGGGKVAKRKSIGSLSLREQVYLAVAGNQRQQLSLVCSPTIGVACSVVASPKMNENMAMSIASLTTANSEALRDLAQNKRYSLQYPIARMLAFNPKCPPQSVVDLLTRLKDADLKSLAKATGIAEVVKSAANRQMAMRDEKRKL